MNPDAAEAKPEPLTSEQLKQLDTELRDASMKQLQALSEARAGMASEATANRQNLSLVLRRPLPLNAAQGMSTQELTKYVAQLSATHNAFVNESAKTGPRLMDSSPMAESYMTLLSGQTLDKGSLAEMKQWSQGME